MAEARGYLREIVDLLERALGRLRGIIALTMSPEDALENADLVWSADLVELVVKRLRSWLE